ncbi:uncharacterized protein LOC111407681 [Olea europaea var. sylvestris]|uniref:uncharacterized protein LOC111407681 n=1 Tax=Olea europaea var. sylvestris TaxID=158386 RepID=UPI000C1D4F9A|nr:uncharacterized protein LOC111407681 [Olea europaea var. sylvestris]
MVEICLMASHGYPLGLNFHHEQVGMARVSKDHPHFLPYIGVNQDPSKLHSINTSLHQREEWNYINGPWDSDQFFRVDSTVKRPVTIDVQGPYLYYIAFPVSVVSQFISSSRTSHWNALTHILKYLKGALGRGILYRDHGHCRVEGFSNANGVGSPVDRRFIIGTKQSMLVPFFERRRRASAKSVVETVKTAPLNSPEKVKGKISQKKKSNRKPGEERDIYGNKYLFACESLLSIMANRKQNGKSAIFSLKKSGPELPQLLTQFSASIAGTGIAVLFSVVCKVACGRVPFCASKILNTGLGLGLVWLSWAIHKLRNTVISISKNSGKLALKEEEMMNNLDKSLKDIYFRIAALMAVTVLRLA